MNFSEDLEVLQPKDEDNVYFRCRRHDYWGSTRAPMAVGCQACWGAHYLVTFGKYKTREGEDEMLEQVLRNAIEVFEKKGEFDFELLKHPRFVKEEGKS